MVATNKDIDYIQKDFDSSVDAMIAYANVNYGPGSSANRLWTTFNKDSFSRNWLEIVAYVSDALFFYFDSQATQSYLQTATVDSAIKDIAKQFGFTPATAASASGQVVFTTTGAISSPGIPRGFRVAATNGNQFYVTSNIAIPSAGEYTASVLQGVIKSENFSAIGLQNEEVNISGTDIIRDLTNINPLDISPQVSINGNKYTLVDSFIRFNGTDIAPILDTLGNIIGGGGRVYTLEERPDGSEFLRFGDGIFGRKLAPGDNIQVSYRTGGGSSGNVSKNTLVQLVDSITNVTSVNNTVDFSGGADAQTIDQLRQLIPASLRTLDRAVAEQDYSDILLANFSEVFSASTERNDDDPGIDLNIYVIPQGTGITKISENPLLITRLSNFLDRRKMVTIQFQILDAFGISTLISLEVFITNTSSKTTVQNAIQTALINFFDLSSGGQSGAGVNFSENILLKDVSDIVQGIDGVDRFEIQKLTYRPRIDEKVLGLLTDYKYSDITIFPTVSESEWMLAAAGPVAEVSNETLYDNTSAIPFTYDEVSGKIQYASEVDLSQVSVGDTFTSGLGVAETSKITTIGDGTGEFEEFKVTAVADEQGTEQSVRITPDSLGAVNGALNGKYFLLQDQAGAVAIWFTHGTPLATEPSHGANRSIVVALGNSAVSQLTIVAAINSVVGADSEFTASDDTISVTITNVAKAALDEVIDGSAPTEFDIDNYQPGVSVNTLSGTYFDISDSSDQVRVWFDVDNTSTAPAAPGTGRLVEVDITANAGASIVAAALQSVLNGDAEYTAVVLSNKVTVTNNSIGLRDNALDGLLATGFTLKTIKQGAPAVSINGKYWLMNSANDAGYYYVWYNNSGTPGLGDPVPVGIDAGIEVAIGVADSATDVATATASAISSFTINEQINIKTINGTTLNGKYFILQDSAGSVAFWYDIGASISEPAHGALRNVEITTILVSDSDDDVATKTAAAINADSQFSASSVAENISVTAAAQYLPDPQPGTSNFVVVTTTQGVDFTASSLGEEVTVSNTFPGATGESFDVDTNFTFETTVKGANDSANLYILGVNHIDNYLYVPRNLDITSTVVISLHGSIKSGNIAFQSFKCFKKILSYATNLSVNSITDNTLDLSIAKGTASKLSARVLLDNKKVFLNNQYATGEFYLVDATGNIWDIVSNTSNTITSGITAINDAAISNVTAGAYKIVKKMVASRVIFNGSIFNIQYNSENTIFSVGAQFPQIGTIGDAFQISEEQTNIGRLGSPVDIISYDPSSQLVRLNGNPDLTGINTEFKLIDSDSNIFNIISVDARSNPIEEYPFGNRSNEIILTKNLADSTLAQGFKVPETDNYTVVSLYARKEGNIVGNLVLRIVKDLAGKPDLTKLVAISKSVSVSTLSESEGRLVFSFANPPILTKDIQYHLVISGDAAYQISQFDLVATYSNSSLFGFTYSVISTTTGLISYSGAPVLASVLPGNFFADNDGNYFKILSIDDTSKTLTISTTATNFPSQIVNDANDGSCFTKDNVHISLDDITTSYSNGNFASFNNSIWTVDIAKDLVFTVEGPRSITIDSNLVPTLGDNATVSTRYYDDSEELSFVLGLSAGNITFASDVNPTGRGTVGGLPNSKLDTFIFRTSRIADDIVNLRLNEIPQLSLDDLEINIFGGVD